MGFLFLLRKSLDVTVRDLMNLKLRILKNNKLDNWIKKKNIYTMYNY